MAADLDFMLQKSGLAPALQLQHTLEVSRCLFVSLLLAYSANLGARMDLQTKEEQTRRSRHGFQDASSRGKPRSDHRSWLLNVFTWPS